MAQISVNFDDMLMEEIKKEAAEKGISPSQYIFLVVDEHIVSKIEKKLEYRKFLREFWETAEPDETFVEPPDFPPEPLDFDADRRAYT